jgi:signal transduction histidine kinase
VKEEETVKGLNSQLENRNKELLIQEERLLEQQDELKWTIAELRDRNFELDQIVYKTSHDLRSPLVSILGLLTLIKEEPSFEQIRIYLDFIESRVTKLDEFVKSMLNFSKINRTQIKPVPVDFSDIINQCFQNLKFLENFTLLEKQIHISGESFVQDYQRLEIIFNNILSNAIKYMNPRRARPLLNIDIRISPEHAEITFTDNGIGIQKEYLDKVFDMFVRATEKSDGSGLGLYIVKQTVERLNGRISVTSTAGEGTEIILVIPNVSLVAYTQATDSLYASC